MADNLDDPTTPAAPQRVEPGLDWAHAARDALAGQRPDATYDVLILTVRPAHQVRLQARLDRLLRRVRTRDGRRPRVFLVPETLRRPGNLVATLLAWSHACAQARGHRIDLARALVRGERIAMVHAAGEGRRAAPLVHAEDGDRGAMYLPGTLQDAPARVLEAVLAQIAPLSASQPPGFLDVIWASQLFLPRLAPDVVPPPRLPLTKLVTELRAPAGADGTERVDVGTFAIDGDVATAFAPQGADGPPTGGRLAADLGSFRIRADLLDVLADRYTDPLPHGPRDLDPHLTGPLLGADVDPALLAEAEAVRAAFGDEPLVGVTDLGPDLPWWRLRRPEELRAFAMDLLPVSARPGAAAIRHLLGIAHPITRSWLGDVWVEGPEIPFEAVEEGVVVGGVHVRQSLVQDAALWGWAGTGRSGVESPALLRSVVIGGTGGLDLEDTFVVASGGPGWRGGGGLAWRATGDPPAAAGPSPTAQGVCTVRRPRLLDGEATFHGFLHEDGKTEEDRPRTQGLTWNALARLPAFTGPRLDPRTAPDLEEVPPHVLLTLPPVVLALLRERIPPSSHLQWLLELAEDGRFVVALHRGSRPDVRLDAPLVPGRAFRPTERAYRVHADLETWSRWQWAPPRIAEALLHAFALHFVPAARHGRDAFARARVEAFRQGPIEASAALQTFLESRILDGDAGSVLDRLDSWTVLDDPDRVEQAAILDALDELRPDAAALRTEPHLRAWVRWCLERRRLAAGVLTDRLAAASSPLLGRCGFTWSHPWVDHGHPFWIPSCSLRPRRAADGHAHAEDLTSLLGDEVLALREAGSVPVLGIGGPAAAGKSSLAVRIAEHLDTAGLNVALIAADEHCWQGDGFRYRQHAGFRDVRIYGPGILDELGLAHAIRKESERRDAVIVEGAYVGLDPEVRALLDQLVCVLLDDRARLDVKYSRDALGGLREIDVVTDFADKVQHESRDGVAIAVAHADRVWDRGTGEVWNRR